MAVLWTVQRSCQDRWHWASPSSTVCAAPAGSRAASSHRGGAGIIAALTHALEILISVSHLPPKCLLGPKGPRSIHSWSSVPAELIGSRYGRSQLDARACEEPALGWPLQGWSCWAVIPRPSITPREYWHILIFSRAVVF